MSEGEERAGLIVVVQTPPKEKKKRKKQHKRERSQLGVAKIELDDAGSNIVEG